MAQKGLDIKKDGFKDKWFLLPITPLRWVVKVLMFGAFKYSTHGWKEGDYEDARQRYYDAAFRHIVVEWWEMGEFFDEETGLPHLAHGCCCILFLLWYDIRYSGIKFDAKQIFPWQHQEYWSEKGDKVKIRHPWELIKKPEEP